jgi:hypothetical protein
MGGLKRKKGIFISFGIKQGRIKVPLPSGQVAVTSLLTTNRERRQPEPPQLYSTCHREGPKDI